MENKFPIDISYSNPLVFGRGLTIHSRDRSEKLDRRIYFGGLREGLCQENVFARR